ncbi:hypothetical protein B1218_33925, partial [Pseudomonas ogarae]
MLPEVQSVVDLVGARSQPRVVAPSAARVVVQRRAGARVVVVAVFVSDVVMGAGQINQAMDIRN